jgi:hypothetical protein
MQIYRSGADADDGRDTESMLAFVDPAPLIAERIAAEVAPLLDPLSQTTDLRERRRLEREILQHADGVRKSLRSVFICW